MEEEQKIEVKFLSSLALAVDALDGIKHVQLTLVQEVESKEIRCYMDVVDPSKVKLADETNKVNEDVLP